MELTAQGFLHLLVNTKDRGAPYQVSGGWSLYAQIVQDAQMPKHRVVAIHPLTDDRAELAAILRDDEGDYRVGAEVVLIAEGEAEGELVQGVAYEAQCKDQVEVLFVPIQANLAPKEVAAWKPPGAST
ncbi:hypothetical protein APY03_0703 [Variovorax sp. WDL1]|nr:hypothetical protein APY03_0703 [Variovorax sp. WDL1]